METCHGSKNLRVYHLKLIQHKLHNHSVQAGNTATQFLVGGRWKNAKKSLSGLKETKINYFTADNVASVIGPKHETRILLHCFKERDY